MNTIVNRGGRLFGFNTDGPGFVAALRNESNFEPAGKSVLLLGAGGAARGIAFALAEARVTSLAISNRSGARATRLAADVAVTGAEVSSVAPGGSLATYDCVVNCTSIGMHGGGAADAVPASLDSAKAGALVVDIVYAPEEKPLLADARRRGMKTLGGLPMLIYQVCLAFEHWTGVSAPIDVMFEAARKELRVREVAKP